MCGLSKRLIPSEASSRGRRQAGKHLASTSLRLGAGSFRRAHGACPEDASSPAVRCRSSTRVVPKSGAALLPRQAVSCTAPGVASGSRRSADCFENLSCSLLRQLPLLARPACRDSRGLQGELHRGLDRPYSNVDLDTMLYMTTALLVDLSPRGRPPPLCRCERRSLAVRGRSAHEALQHEATTQSVAERTTHRRSLHIWAGGAGIMHRKQAFLARPLLRRPDMLVGGRHVWVELRCAETRVHDRKQWSKHLQMSKGAVTRRWRSGVATGVLLDQRAVTVHQSGRSACRPLSCAQDGCCHRMCDNGLEWSIACLCSKPPLQSRSSQAYVQFTSATITAWLVVVH